MTLYFLWRSQCYAEHVSQCICFTCPFQISCEPSAKDSCVLKARKHIQFIVRVWLCVLRAPLAPSLSPRTSCPHWDRSTYSVELENECSCSDQNNHWRPYVQPWKYFAPTRLLSVKTLNTTGYTWIEIAPRRLNLFVTMSCWSLMNVDEFWWIYVLGVYLCCVYACVWGRCLCDTDLPRCASPLVRHPSLCQGTFDSSAYLCG